MKGGEGCYSREGRQGGTDPEDSESWLREREESTGTQGGGLLGPSRQERAAAAQQAASYAGGLLGLGGEGRAAGAGRQ